MKNYRVIISQSAKAGLAEIAEYIALDNPDRAINFTMELAESIQKTLSTFPFGGKPYTDIESDKGDIRTYPYGNYISYYRIKEDEMLVEVLFIFNAKRDVSEFLQNV